MRKRERVKVRERENVRERRSKLCAVTRREGGRREWPRGTSPVTWMSGIAEGESPGCFWSLARAAVGGVIFLRWVTVSLRTLPNRSSQMVFI